MKAISLTSSSFLLSAAFFNNAFANIVTELGPNGLNASVKYTPDRDTLRKRAPAPGGNSDCAKWCAANFPNPGSDCTSLAAHGQGPCYTCGPKKSSPTQLLCGGQCRDTSSSSNNCGACGNKCTTSTGCNNGKCCGPISTPCTISNFIDACCGDSNGVKGCEFRNGNPNDGFCFI